MIDYEADETEKRRIKLEAYFRERMFDNLDPRCDNFSDCKEGVAEKGCKFSFGQLPHVGQRYDAIRNGKQLRLVISGMSTGRQGEFVSMQSNSSGIINRSGMNRRPSKGVTRVRNAHMLGTTLLVRRILLGRESLDSFYDWNSEFVSNPQEPENHFFNYFALVNLVLCSATQGTTQDKSTDKCEMNCLKHYINIIDILQPTILVFQSIPFFKPLISKWTKEGLWEKMNLDFSKKYEVGIYHKDGHECLTFRFYHPAIPNKNRWVKPESDYFENVVNPALNRWLPKLGIE